MEWGTLLPSELMIRRLPQYDLPDLPQLNTLRCPSELNWARPRLNGSVDTEFNWAQRGRRRLAQIMKSSFEF